MLNKNEITMDDFQFVCAQCNNENPDDIDTIFKVKVVKRSSYILSWPNHDAEIGVGLSNEKITLMDTNNIISTQEEIHDAIYEIYDDELKNYLLED